MTENQEKELFNTLKTLVTGVQVIQSDIRDLKTDVQVLKTDVQEIKAVQNEHSQILKRLEAKTDSIADTVMNHEVRLTKVEKDIDELRGGIH